MLLICCCGPGAIGGIAAIVFAILALTKRSAGNEESAKQFQTFAIGSLVVGLALAVVWLIFAGTLFDFGAIQEQLDQIESTGTIPEQ